MNNPCTKTTCENGGTCFADKLGQTKCFCKDGFGGKSCEIDQRSTFYKNTDILKNTLLAKKLFINIFL